MAGYASVGEALRWIATEKGRNVVANRIELLGLLNDVRRYLYSLGEKVQIDFTFDACFEVQKFFEPCISCNCEPAEYFGITLPQHMEAPKAVWVDGSPVTIFNEWLEYQRHIMSPGSSLKVITVGNDFPLQNDWDPRTPVKPVFMATNQADCGKMVHVSFMDCEGRNRTEEIPLSTSGSSIVAEAKQIGRPGGIVLPADLVGGVEVYDCIGGRHLGFLSPSHPIPSSRRIKITGVCCGQKVRVKSTRRYADVDFDWEIVETDNKLAIIEAIRYLDTLRVQSSDAQWGYKGRQHEGNVIRFLGGDNFRAEGPSTVRNIDLFKTPIRKSGLRAHRRRYRP